MDNAYIESRVVNGVMWGVVAHEPTEEGDETAISIEAVHRGGGRTLLELVEESEIDSLISLLRKAKKTLAKGRS